MKWIKCKNAFAWLDFMLLKDGYTLIEIENNDTFIEEYQKASGRKIEVEEIGENKYKLINKTPPKYTVS